MSRVPTLTAMVPYMDVESLCDPPMVEVIIASGEQTKHFRIPFHLICPLSKYFDTAFCNLEFLEAATHQITIRDDVPVWAFITFVGWLYTQRLTLTGTNEASLDDLVRNGNIGDPSTWPYATLFLLYAMADRIDTRALRRLIIEQVQIKMNGTTPQTRPPSFNDMILLQQTTPPSSPLRRYVFFKIRSLANFDSVRAQYYLKFQTNIQFVMESLLGVDDSHQFVLKVKAAQDSLEEFKKDLLHAQQPLTDNTTKVWCLFHEHERDAEKDICEHRLQTIPTRFQGNVQGWIAADEE